MQFLERLDLAILDGFFQPIADWVDDKWGKSCFWLAKAFAWVVVSLMTVMIIDYSINREIFSWHLVMIFLCLWSIKDINEYERLEKNRLNMAATMYANPKRYVESSDRKLIIVLTAMTASGCLGFGLFFVKSILFSLKFTFIMTALCCLIAAEKYFAACIPKPPKPKPVKVHRDLQVIQASGG